MDLIKSISSISFSGTMAKDHRQVDDHKTPAVNQGIFTGQSVSMLNPASITVEIPLSVLKEAPANLVFQVNEICFKTSTHILFEHREDIVSYLVYGKWRNCYAAARLLWYRLSKDYTLYINGAWNSYLDIPVHDQQCRTLASLYPRLTIEPVNEFNSIAVKGSYWEVLKFGKQLISRAQKVSHGDENTTFCSVTDIPSANIMANGILRSMKVANIREDSPSPLDSPFGISDSEILQLLIGPKTKEKSATEELAAAAVANYSSNWQENVHNEEIGLDKLEDFDEEPSKEKKPASPADG